MNVVKSLFPQVNLYSSKILFDKKDERNKKRIAQMLKRKKALSTIDNHSSYHNNSYTQQTIPTNLEISYCDLLKDCVESTENLSIEKIKTTFMSSKNKKNLIVNFKDEFSYGSKKNTLNEINNSSTNNSNNFSNNKMDSIEKEINISNLEDESLEEVFPKIQEAENVNENKNNISPFSLKNEVIDSHEKCHSMNLAEANEFALKYLSCSSDSFVQLDNNLVAKAKCQKENFTDSYKEALFPQIESFMDNKMKNYAVTEIIAEEKEIETPLKLHKKINDKSYLTKNLMRKQLLINKAQKIIGIKYTNSLKNSNNLIDDSNYNNNHIIITSYNTNINKSKMKKKEVKQMLGHSDFLTKTDIKGNKTNKKIKDSNTIDFMNNSKIHNNLINKQKINKSFLAGQKDNKNNKDNKDFKTKNKPKNEKIETNTKRKTNLERKSKPEIQNRLTLSKNKKKEFEPITVRKNDKLKKFNQNSKTNNEKIKSRTESKLKESEYGYKKKGKIAEDVINNSKIKKVNDNGKKTIPLKNMKEKIDVFKTRTFRVQNLKNIENSFKQNELKAPLKHRKTVGYFNVSKTTKSIDKKFNKNKNNISMCSTKILTKNNSHLRLRTKLNTTNIQNVTNHQNEIKNKIVNHKLTSIKMNRYKNLNIKENPLGNGVQKKTIRFFTNLKNSRMKNDYQEKLNKTMKICVNDSIIKNRLSTPYPKKERNHIEVHEISKTDKKIKSNKSCRNFRKLVHAINQ